MIRKLTLLITLLASLTVSPVAHAEWTKVIKNEIGDNFYVNFERIKKHSDKIYYWELIGFFKPSELGVRSNRSYIEAECDRLRIRYLNSTFFFGPMASGTILAEINTPEKNWRYVPPDSVDDLILKAVCNHKP